MAQKYCSRTGRPRVLHVLHSWNTPGGVEMRTYELVRGLSRHFHNSVIYPRVYTYGEADTPILVEKAGRTEVYEMRLGGWNEFDCIRLFPLEITDERSEDRFRGFLEKKDFDLVHFHHLGGWRSLRLPLIAGRLGIKSILSFYDYFLNCPDWNLELPEGARCGKMRTEAQDSTCGHCLSIKRFQFGREIPIPLSRIARYQHDRSVLVQKILSSASGITVCSQFVKDLVVRAYGESLTSKIGVIPRGLSLRGRVARLPRDRTFRVGFVGNFAKSKGAQTFIEAAKKLRENNISFRVFGDIESPMLKKMAVEAGIALQGPYTLETLPRLLESIDVAVILSIWDETYCTVLSELQYLRIPVIATRVGGIQERIVQGKTGFLIPPNDSAILAACLEDLLTSPESLELVHRELKKHRPFRLKDAVDAHEKLYNKILDVRSKHHTSSVGKRLRDKLRQESIETV